MRAYYSPVTCHHSHSLKSAAFDFFEVERRVQRIVAPEPVDPLRQCSDRGRLPAVGSPELRRAVTAELHSRGLSSARILSSGINVSSRLACSISRSMKSSLPASASAFICSSHSSSSSGGLSAAINSQYSSGDSLAMASLISGTVLTSECSRNSAQTARRARGAGGSDW